MPLEFIEIGERRAWGIWRITESEKELEGLLPIYDERPESMTHEEKRLEWIAGRIIAQTLMENFDQPYHGIRKDEFGKPFPIDSNYQISLTHSFPYVAAIIDKHTSVGIDLEQPKQKLLRVAPRILSSDEMISAGEDMVKHCVYWCSKETLIKLYGKKDLTLSENLRIEPFELNQEGYLIGKIIVGQQVSSVSLFYRVYPKFVIVFNSN